MVKTTSSDPVRTTYQCPCLLLRLVSAGFGGTGPPTPDGFAIDPRLNAAQDGKNAEEEDLHGARRAHALEEAQRRLRMIVLALLVKEGAAGGREGRDEMGGRDASELEGCDRCAQQAG